MPRRVLVTGSSGVIGRALLEELRGHDYDVLGINTADADLTVEAEATALLARTRPDVVVHLAARVHGIMGNANRHGLLFLENLRINTNVIEAARLAGVQKFVGMGSIAMYADNATTPITEDQIWDGRPYSAEVGYAQAKRAMLAQLETYKSQYGMDFAVAVSTNLYGPEDRFDEAHGHVLPSLVSKFHRAVHDGGPLEVWGTGKSQRDFLYSADAAKGIRRILESYTGVINLATGSSVSIAEAVETLRTIAGYDGPVAWDITKPEGQAARVYDVSRLRALGWAPTYSLQAGLRATYDWFTANVPAVRR